MSWSPRDAKDHPSARSPHHARFPSVSEFSDSPSTYSNTCFSPPCPDTREIEPSSSYDVPPRHARSSADRRPSNAHRDRLNDPAASSLDLDDEYAAGSSPSSADAGGDTENEEEGDDASHRISIQGPKIRFHSRAPWETGDDAFDENESDHSGMSNAFGRKVKSKTAEAGLMRHFGRGSSRPSVDSNRSQTLSKGSFETTERHSHSNSRGALYTLAQESFSTSSLTVPSRQYTAPSPRNRHNFSLPRTANYPLTTTQDPQSDNNPRRMTRFSQDDTRRPHSPASDIQGDHKRSDTPSSFSQDGLSQEDFVHPYANPDLVVPYSPPRPVPSLHPTFDATIPEPLSSHSGAFPLPMSPDTSTSSVPSTTMRIHGKDISHPIAVFHTSDLNSAQSNDRSTKLMSLHPPPILEGVLPGWNLQPSSSVNLISLQEAQARERTRSATANSTTSPPPRAHERLSFPEPDDTASIASTETSATGNFMRVRARSISAGAHTKGVLHPVGASLDKPERRDSEPAVVHPGGQTLKHKRSGFMRLFNGREREKGRDKERSPPPPVPSLRRIYSEHPHGAYEDGKSLLPIIPPRLASLISNDRSSITLSESSSDAEQGLSIRLSSASSKRIPPHLHISTSASSTHSPAPVTLGQNQPQRAPTGSLDFPALKLRPVSTTFSSQFADIVAIPEAESISELELDTPTSTSTISSIAALSPFTSGSSRPSDDKPSPVEQSLIIKALQEQIISSKRAWQQQIWELQGQVRDLKAEVEDLRCAEEGRGYCEHCSRGNPKRDRETSEGTKKVSIVNRSRGRVGSAARFASGNWAE